MQDNIPVLIVGAGPCGLAAAAFLTHYKVPCRIIDKKSGPTQTSNAVGVQARTMELLEELSITPQFLNAGKQINGGQAFINKKNLAKFSLKNMPSLYNFVCDIPQNQTEKNFIDYLQQHGVTIEYNTTAIAAEHRDNDCVTITVTTSLGSSETITANWVIAADGYHSFIREAFKIPYTGKEFTFKFLMIDAPIEAKEIDDDFFFGLNDETTCLIFPMQKSARIIIETSHTNKYDNVEPTSELFTNLLTQVFPFPIKVGPALWQSKFFVHERLAAQYRHDRIFLLGDAAHAHIPAAGQGMNTGIQDAINLAWKLAHVIQNKAKPTLLDTYQEERRPVAQSVLLMTDTMGNTLLTKKPLRKLMRNLLASTLLKLPFVQKMAASKIGELTINYRSSSLTHGKPLAKLIPGNRFANMPLKPLNGNYLILDFTGTLSATAIDNTVASIHIVSETEKSNYFSGKTHGYCVIRPDRYIGCIARSLEDLHKYFKNNLFDS